PDPTAFCAPEPAPFARASGSTPNENASEVITIGLKRVRAASTTASFKLWPRSEFSFAVLIVEFAKENFDRGQSLKDAVVLAARTRFRPIVMTSLAFSFGVLPLALANGAGSGAQNAVGSG